MKRELIALSIGFSLLSSNLLADHRTQQRSSCTVLAKYRAVAKLKKTSEWFWHENANTGCSWAHAAIQSSQIEPGVCNDMPLTHCGFSECYIGNDGFWTDGWGTPHGWEWGSDKSNIEAIFSYAPMISKVNRLESSESSFIGDHFKGDPIIFDEAARTITIKNLEGFLAVKASDKNNAFTTMQFKVFSEKVIDGESIPQRTIWYAKATVIGGELLTEGNFAESDFTDVSNENMSKYTIEKDIIVIQIPADVDFSSLVIDLAGDGGNLGLGISDDYAPDLTNEKGQQIIKNITTKADFNYTAFHNSQKEVLEVDVTKKSDDQSLLEANIFTLDGKLIKTFSVENGESSHHEFSTSDLRAGPYLFNYKVNDKYYFRKFIK